MPYVSCLMPYAALPPLRAWLAARVFSSVSICTFVLVKQVNYLCLPIVFKSSAWWSIMPACPQRVCMRYYATALRYYATALCTQILCYCSMHWEIMLLHWDIKLLLSAWWSIMLACPQRVCMRCYATALRYYATALCVRYYATAICTQIWSYCSLRDEPLCQLVR